MRFYTVAPFIAGALIGLVTMISPLSALGFCAVVLTVLLVYAWDDKARQRRQDKIIADARMHTAQLTCDAASFILSPADLITFGSVLVG